ncbi:MAG: Ig-like domain-containing protein [Sphingomonas sp.]|jgi:YD repeat-containing protein
MKLGRVLVGTSLGALAAVLAAVGANAQSSTETYSYDALGRLISVVTTGGQNNAETHSICYDDAGNRTQYVSDSLGAPASCAGGSPPPPPSNSPPVTQSDWASVFCLSTGSINLTANDSDPDGDSLTLIAITRTSGGFADANIVSASTVNLIGDSEDGTTEFTYTVGDGRGGTATGQLSVDTFMCSGDPI